MPLISVVPEKKGTSGNRKGNPGKDKFFRTALLMELKSKGQDMPELHRIARTCIDLALGGEPWAVKEIGDRLDGKASVVIELDGKPVRYYVPAPAVKDGILYVTEDRKAEGFFETMSIAENLYSGLLAAGLERLPYVSMREMRDLSQHWSKSLNVRAINDNARVIELSGGNQQKVVIGKSLVQKPKLVIFDEPTRGVDVGAIAEIHQIINKLADDGLAVVVISSYLPEIMNLSDRILVCRQGRIVEELSPQDATEEKIMYAAVH